MKEELRINLERAWLNHCRSESSFPRDMLFLNKDGKGRRFKAKDFNYLFKKSLFFLGKRHTYVSVYSDSDIERGVVDRIFLDIDSPKDLDAGFSDVRKIISEHIATVYFTGYGGFGVYLSFSAIRLKNPRYAIREFVMELDRKLGLDTLDWHVVGDLRRVSRLPYTVNLKNDKLCIPILPQWSLDFILEQARKCNTFLPIRFKPSTLVRHLLEAYDKHSSEKIEYEPPSLDEKEQFESEVKQLLEIAPQIEDGRHTLIFHGIVPRMILSGKSDDEILGVCHEFITLTPDTPEKGKWKEEYEGYVRRDIESTRRRVMNGEPLKYSMSSIIMERPELLKFFKK